MIENTRVYESIQLSLRCSEMTIFNVVAGLILQSCTVGGSDDPITLHV